MGEVVYEEGQIQVHTWYASTAKFSQNALYDVRVGHLVTLSPRVYVTLRSHLNPPGKMAIPTRTCLYWCAPVCQCMVFRVRLEECHVLYAFFFLFFFFLLLLFFYFFIFAAIVLFLNPSYYYLTIFEKIKKLWDPRNYYGTQGLFVLITNV